MLNKFLAWGLGGRKEVEPSEGCSKGTPARREKRWPDSEELALPPGLGQPCVLG